MTTNSMLTTVLYRGCPEISAGLVSMAFARAAGQPICGPAARAISAAILAAPGVVVDARALGLIMMEAAHGAALDAVAVGQKPVRLRLADFAWRRSGATPPAGAPGATHLVAVSAADQSAAAAILRDAFGMRLLDAADVVAADIVEVTGAERAAMLAAFAEAGLHGVVRDLRSDRPVELALVLRDLAAAGLYPAAPFADAGLGEQTGLAA